MENATGKIKKPFFKRWWFWAIVVVIVIAALSSQGGTDTNIASAPDTSKGTNVTSAESSNSTLLEKTNLIENLNPKSKIEFKNVITNSNLGMTTVYGEVNNTDTKAHSFTLKVSFYDKDKKLLGTAAGAVNDLNGGSSKIFSAMGTEDYSKADSYKVQVDTVVSSSENKNIPIEFTNVVLKDDLGMLTVEGEAKNNDTSTHSFTLAVGLYDANNKLLGVASGAVNDIVAGETMTFSAMSADNVNGVKSYKVQVDTLVE